MQGRANTNKNTAAQAWVVLPERNWMRVKECVLHLGHSTVAAADCKFPKCIVGTCMLCGPGWNIGTGMYWTCACCGDCCTTYDGVSGVEMDEVVTYVGGPIGLAFVDLWK